MQAFLIFLLGAILITRCFLWVLEWVMTLALEGALRIYVAAFGTFILSLMAGARQFGFWPALLANIIALAMWTTLDVARLKRSSAKDGAI